MKLRPLPILFLLTLSLITYNYVEVRSEKPLVVTTTSVLASIVRDLAGDLVEVRYLVSPSMCPGHYDVKPGDVETIRRASLILAHGMEWPGWLRDLIETANQTGDLYVPIRNITGPWNSPPMLKQRYSAVANVLEEVLGLSLDDRLSKCLTAIDAVDEELKDYAKDYGFNNTPVVVMRWQVGFVSYLGFKVVATYGPPEYLSTEDIIEIENNATKYGAKLIIDNLHSGVDVGAKIAEDVGAVHVVLINFPEAVPGVNNVTEMMLYNAKVLADGLNKYETIKEMSSLKQEIELWKYVSWGCLFVIMIETALIIVMVKRRGR